MARQRWSTWDQFKRDLNNTFRSEVPIDYGTTRMGDRDFESYWGNYPFMDIEENDEELIIKVDLPGFDKDEIQVNLTENELEVRALKENEENEDTFSILRERTSASCYRKITLPDRVYPEKAIATYNKGVLQINAPKIENTRRRSLTID